MHLLLYVLACTADPQKPGGGGDGGAAGGSTGGTSGAGGAAGGAGGTTSATYVGELADLCINEFMPANDCSSVGGGYEDWIELHNSGAFDIDLAGWSMSDDETDPTRHVFAGGIVVPSGGFLLLFTSGGGPDSVNFGLDAAGEQVGLFAPDGSGEVVNYGAVGDDRAIARDADCLPGNEAWKVISGGTPGGTNGGTPITPFCPTPTDTGETGETTGETGDSADSGD